MIFTPQDFEVFSKAIHHWVEKLHLQQWRIHIKHSPIQNYAETHYNCTSHQVTFILTTGVEELHLMPYTIEELAKHEVLHLLLSEWGWVVAQCKNDYDQVAVGKEHAIINTLMEVIS